MKRILAHEHHLTIVKNKEKQNRKIKISSKKEKLFNKKEEKKQENKKLITSWSKKEKNMMKNKKLLELIIYCSPHENNNASNVSHLL